MHAWWFMAHGSRLMAKGGSWLMARGRPDPGNPRAGGAGPGPEARLWVPRARPGRSLAMSHEPPPASLGHEPWALSHEPWTIKHASSIKHQALRNWAPDSGKKLRNVLFQSLSFLLENFFCDEGGVCVEAQITRRRGLGAQHALLRRQY